MNNTFDFSYFVPTPDTTANCALSRWNDSLMGLSDFLKAYMSSRQSLEFGFSRNLNIKELLNLVRNAAENENGKKDFAINYRKFGDVKAHICGFEVPILSKDCNNLTVDFAKLNEQTVTLKDSDLTSGSPYNYIDCDFSNLNNGRYFLSGVFFIYDNNGNPRIGSKTYINSPIINKTSSSIEILNDYSSSLSVVNDTFLRIPLRISINNVTLYNNSTSGSSVILKVKSYEHCYFNNGISISRVFNLNDTTASETDPDPIGANGRRLAFLESLDQFRSDITDASNQTIMANYDMSKQELLDNINDIYSFVEDVSLLTDLNNIVFKYRNEAICKNNYNGSYYVKNINKSVTANSGTDDQNCIYNCDESFIKDIVCNTTENSFVLPTFNFSKQKVIEFINNYCHKNDIDVRLDFGYTPNILCQGIPATKLINSHLFIRFILSFREEPCVAPFVSHDGTEVPLSKQYVSIGTSLSGFNDFESDLFYFSDGSSAKGLFKSDWDNVNECPIYYDKYGNKKQMTLENNIDGMGGRDYTIWSSPVQKTENGYQFECCMPLAFYNAETGSYSNEYYAKKAHDGIEIGDVMYRVPVVKRMRQNIEEAVVNTHLAKCLGDDLVSATNANAEDDDTVVLGGVVVDDFTEGLYTVAETQKIATETDYGEVKIVRATEDVIALMYHYSETGDLTFHDVTMPEIGRAVDMITLFDVLKEFNGGNPVYDYNYVVNGNNNKIVNINTDGKDITVKDSISNYESHHSEINITSNSQTNNYDYNDEIILSSLGNFPGSETVYSKLNVGKRVNLTSNDYVAGEILLETYYTTSTSSSSDIPRTRNSLSMGGYAEGINIISHDAFDITCGNDTNYNCRIRMFGNDNTTPIITFDLSNGSSLSEKGLDLYGETESSKNIITLEPNFTTDTTDYFYLGTKEHKFTNFYCKNIITESTQDVSGQSNSGMNIFTDNTGADNKTCVAFKHDFLTSRKVDTRIELIVSETEYTNNSREIIQEETVNGLRIKHDSVQKISISNSDVFDLGASNNRFSSVYCDYINKNTNSYQNPLKIYGEVEFRNIYANVDDIVLKIYSNNSNSGLYLNKDIIPYDDNVNINIGNENRYVNNIYCKDPSSLRGIITENNKKFIKIGGIGVIHIGLLGNDNVSQPMYRGDIIKNRDTIGSNTILCKTVQKNTKLFNTGDSYIELEYYTSNDEYSSGSEFYLLEDQINVPGSTLGNRMISALVIRKS